LRTEPINLAAGIHAKIRWSPGRDWRGLCDAECRSPKQDAGPLPGDGMIPVEHRFHDGGSQLRHSKGAGLSASQQLLTA
jgi:hypothetical protein